MENSVVICCPCCGQMLEVFPGNWLMGSVVRLLPRNTVDADIFNGVSQNCILNSQNVMSFHDIMSNVKEQL